MPIKRFLSIADTTITNSRRDTLTSSGSLSNAGAADSGQIFSIWNSTGFNTGSSENDISRILIKFNITDISNDSSIPPNAEVRLKLFDVAHPETLPRDYTLAVHPLTRAWTEGRGLDLENFYDLGVANWLFASTGQRWTLDGGDYDASIFTQPFVDGNEDLDINVSSLYAQWKSGSLSNHGVVVKLSGSEYTSDSYYKKMFSMRGSEFFFNRPCLEVRWDDSRFDDRNNAYASSSIANSIDNQNNLFYYNRVRGRLKDLPIVETTGSVFIRLYTGSISGIPIAYSTGSWYDTGIYTTSFSTVYSATQLTDVWYHHDNSTIIFTGTINSSLGRLKEFVTDYHDWSDEFVLTMPNLKSKYKPLDNPRLDLFVRNADWKATVYVKSTPEQETEFIKNAYYRVRRPLDGRTIVDFGTGSIQYTKLSYDKDSNFFFFNMSLLETGYEYQFDFLFDVDGKKSLQTDKFKFRVEV